MKNREQFDTYMCDLQDVFDGEKDLVIISSGKSTLAYETATMMAERANLHVELAVLRCEDGLLHEHVFISGRVQNTVNTALAAIRLIEKAKAGDLSRPELQYYLGQMLGYSVADILNFVASKVARDCPCDCCGGPFVSEEITG